MAWLLEGVHEDELPEALLGTVRFNFVDLNAYRCVCGAVWFMTWKQQREINTVTGGWTWMTVGACMSKARSLRICIDDDSLLLFFIDHVLLIDVICTSRSCNQSAMSQMASHLRPVGQSCTRYVAPLVFAQQPCHSMSGVATRAWSSTSAVRQGVWWMTGASTHHQVAACTTVLHSAGTS